MHQMTPFHLEHCYASITPVPNTEDEAIVNELLTRFGAKSALDTVKFMQSPAGKLTQACLNQAIRRNIDAQNLARFLEGLELQKRQHLAYLILSLEHDKEKAHQHILRMEEEEQAQFREHHKPSFNHSIKRPSLIFYYEETLAHYEKAKEALLKEMEFTTDEVSHLEHELFAIEESVALLHTKKQLEAEIHGQLEALKEGDELDLAYIDSKVNEAVQGYQQEIATLQQPSIIHDDVSFIEHWNLLDRYHLQANSWHELRSALSPEQVIVQKNGVLYLIRKHTPFESLSLEERGQAAHAYLSLKPKIEKTRIQTEAENQMQATALQQRKQHLMSQIDFEKNKINFFQTRLSALDQSIFSLSQLIQREKSTESERVQAPLQLQLRPTPQPKTAPTPRPVSLPKNILNPATIQLAHQKQLILKLEMCRLRCEGRAVSASALSAPQLSRITAIERAKLVEELKAKPKELIPGAQASPSLLSMLIAFNKTTLNIDKRVNNTPEQRLEDSKNDPTMLRPSPFKKPWEV